MKRYLLTAAILTVSVTGLAHAQGVSMKADDIILARQGGQALVGGMMEAFKAAVKAGDDVKPYAETGAAIAKWAKSFPTLFPDGTQTGHDTKAKAEIWSDRAGFEKADAALVTAAGKLGDAAKAGDKVAFASAVTEMGQACGGCHRVYKAR